MSWAVINYSCDVWRSKPQVKCWEGKRKKIYIYLGTVSFNHSTWSNMFHHFPYMFRTDIGSMSIKKGNMFWNEKLMIWLVLLEYVLYFPGDWLHISSFFLLHTDWGLPRVLNDMKTTTFDVQSFSMLKRLWPFLCSDFPRASAGLAKEI